MRLRSQAARLPLLAAAFALTLLLAGLPFSHAQGASPATNVADASALHPPAGGNVAIVEFSDMECPACAHVNPLLKDAVAKYHIPLVRHDLVIPGHPWSPIASVNARWFDTKGNGLGDEYRDAVFASQSSIYNVNVLAQFTQKFAASHNLQMPFSVDPQGKLAAAVKADTDLGRRTGIVRTPTIFIVMAHSQGASYIEVLNAQTDLYRDIDLALAQSKAPAPRHPAASHRPARK